MLAFAVRSLAMARVKTMRPEKVLDLQSTRLRSLVRHAVEKTGFY
jgi:hypothetical protein